MCVWHTSYVKTIWLNYLFLKSVHGQTARSGNTSLIQASCSKTAHSFWPAIFISTCIG
ncbi:hypothetical protein PF005_g5883 [Phytophthora fragariae]|uniref:Uncharacterized protein n=1 Tax=Phytophthora fragariae TaxID=53985 RepID=A0A6A4EE86_9STRA|nr:hypothetical protein PF003_g13442 [Phytophthora fragariae]KAE8943877.1 hypothetical protein PF009_g6421 [Phytophthora fragariae]KAE9020848.1 hypothetical protein PF011_g5224 [Phytophthora fragariae]KAE9094230.1 hypothetical protein PF010_g17188 [Phytophthora fragariae]KAE9137607.1 hypothetical protein PF007_g1731 [Phytophthora fragariae]